MKAEAVAEPMKQSPNRPLRTRILAADTSHESASLKGGDDVHGRYATVGPLATSLTNERTIYVIGASPKNPTA
jgi:hypothetical protein